MSTIMPVSGNDIGFSARSWKRVESIVRKARGQVGDEDAYMDDLLAMRVTSSTPGDADVDERVEFERDPGSSWGGREVGMGNEYSIDVSVTLQGKVRYPYPGTDQEAAVQIAKDFDEFWDENPSCLGAVKDAGLRLHGEDEKVESHSAVVTSMTKGPDGQHDVTIEFKAVVTNYESPHDVRMRFDQERE